MCINSTRVRCRSNTVGNSGVRNIGRGGSSHNISSKNASKTIAGESIRGQQRYQQPQYQQQPVRLPSATCVRRLQSADGASAAGMGAADRSTTLSDDAADAISAAVCVSDGIGAVHADANAANVSDDDADAADHQSINAAKTKTAARAEYGELVVTMRHKMSLASRNHAHPIMKCRI